MRKILEICVGYFIFYSLTSSTFVVGIMTGIYISTKYDCKPYVILVENYIQEQIK